MQTLYYFHDPMCSWCYAFDNTLTRLQQQLPASVNLIKITGGLAADSIVPMSQDMIDAIQKNWRRIENVVTGVTFNYDFWQKNTPYRSTYLACRAVICATKQNTEFETKMIHAIQQAYYQDAKNPSIATTLFKCAESIGLNVEQFQKDIDSEAIDQELKKQINFSYKSGISSYPSLLLLINKQHHSIEIDYNNEKLILEQINNLRKRNGLSDCQ